MGKIRLKVRQYADKNEWTLREVSNRSRIPYATVKKYAQAMSLATVDYTALIKLSNVFEITIDELVEILEE
jgi:putative transcriptional regulator